MPVKKDSHAEYHLHTVIYLYIAPNGDTTEI